MTNNVDRGSERGIKKGTGNRVIRFLASLLALDPSKEYSI
jgi:hypothetical protein